VSVSTAATRNASVSVAASLTFAPDISAIKTVDVSGIFAALTFSASARYKWEDQPNTPEVWTDISDNSAFWTDVEDQSATWSDAA
jgi:hypothetical protein